MKFKCPGCQSFLTTPDSEAGKIVNCRCGKKLRAPGSVLTVKCPACQALLSIPESLAGKVVKCPCNKQLRVPNGSPRTSVADNNPSSASPAGQPPTKERQSIRNDERHDFETIDLLAIKPLESPSASPKAVARKRKSGAKSQGTEGSQNKAENLRFYLKSTYYGALILALVAVITVLMAYVVPQVRIAASNQNLGMRVVSEQQVDYSTTKEASSDETESTSPAEHFSSMLEEMERVRESKPWPLIRVVFFYDVKTFRYSIMAIHKQTRPDPKATAPFPPWFSCNPSIENKDLSPENWNAGRTFEIKISERNVYCLKDKVQIFYAEDNGDPRRLVGSQLLFPDTAIGNLDPSDVWERVVSEEWSALRE